MRVYLWSGVKSVASFAKEVDIPQKTMDNYLKEINKTRIVALQKVLNRFEEINGEWLMYRFREMSVNGDNKRPIAPQSKLLIATESTQQDLIKEFFSSLGIIVKQVLRKIAKALECPTKEEADEHLKELEETLNDMGIV